MNIRDGTPNPIYGTVVFVIDNNEYTPEFPADEWNHYGKGFMIKLMDGTLIMYDNTNDDHLAYISQV